MSPAGAHWIAGNFGRYYFPLFPVVAVLGVLGLERAAAALGPRVAAGRLRLPLRAALAALLLWPTAAALVEGPLFYARNVANVQASDVRVARWLAPRLPPEAVLAVNDIGALKFLLPNRVIDLAGIATPEVRRRMNAAAARREPWERAVADYLAERRPDYLVIFPDWFPNLSQRPPLPAGRRRARRGQHHHGRRRGRGLRHALDPPPAARPLVTHAALTHSQVLPWYNCVTDLDKEHLVVSTPEAVDGGAWVRAGSRPAPSRKRGYPFRARWRSEGSSPTSSSPPQTAD